MSAEVAVAGGHVERACDRCLRRLHLIGLLTPFIEAVATGETGRRSPQLLALDDERLARATAGRKADRILGEAADADLDALRDRIEATGCWSVCRHSGEYPAQLLDLGDAPPALICRGDRSGLARLALESTVTVVGARRATSYGRRIADELGATLAGAGMTVVSGLAWGVDGAAHDGALRGGITVAVLGCGADVAYPRHHAKLYDQICEHGLVISELPPGSSAWKWAFPARNRIMAALAGMTVVVEAAGRSGSLITSDLASELGREVGAVPGPVGARMSVGTNDLISDGAHVIRDAGDVLDALIGPGVSRPVLRGPAIDAEQATVLEVVEGGDGNCDSIAIALDREAEETMAALARLELLGYLQRSFSGAYVRTTPPAPLA